jgi:hypothetical protein
VVVAEMEVETGVQWHSMHSLPNREKRKTPEPQRVMKLV